MVHQYTGYALMVMALAVLISSTVKIGVAILKTNNINTLSFNIDYNDVNENRVLEEPTLYDVTILPINQRKLAVEGGKIGPGAVSDVLPNFIHQSQQTRRRTQVNENKLPYKCGVILYNHYIPGEGGVLLDKWMANLVQSNEHVSYTYQSSQDDKEIPYQQEIEKQISSVGSNEWKIINAKHNDGASYANSELLQKWRDTIEKQNCQLITSVIFVDPLDHSIKHTKQRYVDCGDSCNIMEFKDTMMNEVGNGDAWVGQLNGFLFNGDYDAMSQFTMKESIKKAMVILKEQFDIVLIDGEEGSNFAEEILRLTGLKSDTAQIEKASISDGGLVYSKDLVSKFGKMSSKNGDADFLDAVKHVYHNSLAYLMLQ